MKNGHELATLSTGTTSVTYNYNVDSVRIKKTVNGVVHEYVVDGYKILEEKYGSTVLKFTYDENDSPQSISANGTVYYYGKNLQGDIVKIYDASGNAIAGYTYDAWGNVISISYTNIYGMASANTNPFRYRGYYYDTESGLYYLNSRYYDAKVGRFINADEVEILGITGTHLSFNAFSYCENNPIYYQDPLGLFYLSYNKLKNVFDTISLLSQICRIYIGKGMWGVLYGYLAPFIPAVFSWINSLPLVGQIIFCIIVAAAVWFASVIILSYYVYKSGVEISVKWKYFIPYLNVVYR